MSTRVGVWLESSRLWLAVALLVGLGAVGGTAVAVAAVSPSQANRLIGFLHQGAAGRELWTVRADGKHGRKLASGNVRMFVWSSRGKKVAYLRGRPESNHADIYVVNADGTGQRRILRHVGGEHPDAEEISWIAWSHDGNKIAFMSNRAAEHIPLRSDLKSFDYDLYVIDVDGTGLRNLTPTRPGDIRSQDWSPDGKHFVLFDWPDQIDVMNCDGSNLHLVFTTTPDFQVQTVIWSPDGRQILFSEYDPGSPYTDVKGDIALINADGHNRRVLTRNLYDERPTFSPTSRKVAFTRRVGLAPGVDQYDSRIVSKIYLVNANGTQLHRLPHTGPIIHRGRPGDGRPLYSWSPDGKQIAYTSAPNAHIEQQEIYTINTDGSHKHRLTHNKSSDIAPAWQPRPHR